MTDDDKSGALGGTHLAETSGADLNAGAAAEILDAAEPDQPDLLVPPDDLAHELPLDLASMQGAEKRDRGRPKGSKNRKDADLIQYLMARGYHSPLEAGAALYNMNTKALALQISMWRAELRVELMASGHIAKEELDAILPSMPVDPMEVLKLQATVMAAHLPFWHSKQSGDDAPPDQQRALMLFGDMNITQVNQVRGMSAGRDPKTIDNQSLSDDE
ncbi:MAG: hypothetical protein JKY94_10045 [Rhodobacteraceae bacterium]|nr:hypothetical protein [Paracoccaceae bacterium]